MTQQIDWSKQLDNAFSPFTRITNKDGENDYNWLGTALLGGGSGLLTWAISRILGIKSGPSMFASIMASLFATHYSLSKQKGIDPFNFDQTGEMYGDISTRLHDWLKGKIDEKVSKPENNSNPPPQSNNQPTENPPKSQPPVPPQTQPPINNPPTQPTTPPQPQTITPEQQQAVYNNKINTMRQVGNVEQLPTDLLTAPRSKLLKMAEKQDLQGFQAMAALKRRTAYNQQQYKQDSKNPARMAIDWPNDYAVTFNPKYHPVNAYDERYSSYELNDKNWNNWTPEERKKILANQADDMTRSMINGIPWASSIAGVGSLYEALFHRWGMPGASKFTGAPAGWKDIVGETIFKRLDKLFPPK